MAQQARMQQSRTQQARPMVTILLKNWKPRSSVVTQETFVPKAKYPAIDVHARGIGEIMEKGGGFTRDPKDKMHPDDPRMNAFWEKAAELKMPVSIHIADHPSCWTPLDDYQERSPGYQNYNQVGKDVLSYEDCLIMMGRMLTRHPKTTFILCHLANQGNDLGELSKKLYKYPNLFLDISARDYEVGRTPGAAAKFLAKYPNRVLFGTDLSITKSMYQGWWRLFETADEYLPGRVWWMLYGLELPATVLEPLYRGQRQEALDFFDNSL